MPVAKILRIYLDRAMLETARSGAFNFVNRITNLFEDSGFRVVLCNGNDSERLKSAGRRGYALFLMEDPFHPNALTMRRSYFFPFWRIESSAKRWEFEVAQKAFTPDEIDADVAAKWARGWRKWTLKTTIDKSTHDGPVYVPLQGRLLEQRSFQTASPLEMIEHVLEQMPDAPILAGLHPSETYSDAELMALDRLVQRHARLESTVGNMQKALANCRMVVTENSSAALFGYFMHKPAVLFGQIDFHHIAANVDALGVAGAFEAVREARPEFDKYLYWFTQLNAIKADEDDAEDQIRMTVEKRGWRLD